MCLGLAELDPSRRVGVRDGLFWRAELRDAAGFGKNLKYVVPVRLTAGKEMHIRLNKMPVGLSHTKRGEMKTSNGRSIMREYIQKIMAWGAAVALVGGVVACEPHTPEPIEPIDPGEGVQEPAPQPVEPVEPVVPDVDEGDEPVGDW